MGFRAFGDDRRVFQGRLDGEPGVSWRVRKGSAMEEMCSFMKGILP